MYFIACIFDVLMVGKVERPTVCSLCDGRLVRSIPNALIWNVLQSVFLNTGDLSKGKFCQNKTVCGEFGQVVWSPQNAFCQSVPLQNVIYRHFVWFVLDVFLLCPSSGCELISYFILTHYVLMYTQLLLLDKLCSKQISSSFEKTTLQKHAIYIVLSI